MRHEIAIIGATFSLSGCAVAARLLLVYSACPLGVLKGANSLDAEALGPRNPCLDKSLSLRHDPDRVDAGPNPRNFIQE
jgi:hypothetical protein